jgi:hypothetical protein
MARTRWPLKCSEFDGAEKRDKLPTAGLTLPRWKSNRPREYQGSVQPLAASCARPIVTQTGAKSWPERERLG